MIFRLNMRLGLIKIINIYNHNIIRINPLTNFYL